MSSLLAAPVFATHTLAPNEHLLQITPSIDYEFPANEPQLISNVFRWTINAECTVIQSDETSTISFKILRKTGTVNDITLARGESLSMDVHLDETFQISAAPFAAVEITNEGETTLIAHCSAVTETK